MSPPGNFRLNFGFFLLKRRKNLRFPHLLPIWVGDKKSKIHIIILAGAVQGGYKACHGLEKEYGVPRDRGICHISGRAPTDSEIAPTVFYYSTFY